MRVRLPALVSSLALLAACTSGNEPADPAASERPATSRPTAPDETTGSPQSRLMPDLVGLPSVEAGEKLVELGLGSSWGPPVAVRCEARPRTVASQRPAAGTPLRPDLTVWIRTAALDLERFRGPCDPNEPQVGTVAAADAGLAREFYRFAADPSLGSPFAGGDVWVGIEDGPESTSLGADELKDLASWELDTTYAERSGPFSPLDTLAESGGYYDLSDGVVATCARDNDKAPPELKGLRAISFTSPDDVTGACLEWWGVTLFLDDEDQIKGVALRLGSP